MIEQGQEFKCKNLLSFRKNITKNEMKTEMEKLDKFMKENNNYILNITSDGTNHGCRDFSSHRSWV